VLKSVAYHFANTSAIRYRIGWVVGLGAFSTVKNFGAGKKHVFNNEITNERTVFWLKKVRKTTFITKSKTVSLKNQKQINLEQVTCNLIRPAILRRKKGKDVANFANFFQNLGTFSQLSGTFFCYLRSPSQKWDQNSPPWGNFHQETSFWSAWSIFWTTAERVSRLATTSAPPRSSPSRSPCENPPRHPSTSPSSASPFSSRSTIRRPRNRRHPR